MLWFKRPPNVSPSATTGPEVVTPAPLAVELDERVFVQKFAVLLEQIGETGGIDAFLEALGKKSRLFEQVLSPAEVRTLTLEKAELLLETVMPARKRLWPVLVQLGAVELASVVSDLLYGETPLEQRLTDFVERVPAADRLDKRNGNKLRRAAHDFAAELLHFHAPQQYPLMTKWVWDQATHSGALRELVKGGDALQAVPLGASPGVYEAGRVWIAQQLAKQGVYREPHYIVDLFLAHAYADYMRAMSSGMGLINADFGGKADPLEVVKKLLGIDQGRRKNSRVTKAVEH